MTATTDILAFAEGAGANVLTQAQYAALTTLLADGFTTGILTSAQLNKVLRQSSFMAAGFANWIVSQGISVPDDGNMANLVTEIGQALKVYLGANIGATYAGNPNGHVAGNAGVDGVSFPTLLWDTTNNLLWVCVTTGTTATAVWIELGGAGALPFWCGTSTGTANAQVLATPASLQSFVAGDSVAFIAGFTNTAATSITVGTFGTFQLRKDSPTGPIALAGGELVAGNIVSGRFDGTYIQLTATEMGTAALANASSNTGTVAAVSGPVTAGNLAEYNDVNGTVKNGPALSSNSGTVATVSGAGSITPGHLLVAADPEGTVGDGGPPGGAAAPMYVNASTTASPGPYLTDTSAGSFTITLPATPVLGTSCEFIDGPGTWGANNLTIGHNGHTIMGNAEDLVCNVSGEDFRIWYNGFDWRLE